MIHLFVSLCRVRHVLGFYVNKNLPNMLFGWISRSGARSIEYANDDDLKNGIQNIFSKFLTDFNVTKIEKAFTSKWYSNRNFKGAYSYRSVNDRNNVNTRNSMAEPLLNSDGKIIVQFAGEATHSIYYSTVHGAIESGWREAQRLTDLYPK